MKDWVGNTNSVFKGLGASNHCSEERQNEDYYATPRIAVEKLLEHETFSHEIWECACGENHIANVLKEYGYEVRSSDIVDRCGNEVLDFLSTHTHTHTHTQPRKHRDKSPILPSLSIRRTCFRYIRRWC